MTGAVRNGIEEKSINLDIVLALKEQLDSYSGDKRLGIFYTRTTDTNPTLQQLSLIHICAILVLCSHHRMHLC